MRWLSLLALVLILSAGWAHGDGEREQEDHSGTPGGAADESSQRSPDEADETVEEASEKQELSKKGGSTSRIIDLAPPAMLAGDGDLEVSGPCETDIALFCPTVKPGYGHLAECIQNQLEDEDDGQSDFTTPVSGPCKAALLKYKMDLVTNINMDVVTAEACKKDAEKLCEYVNKISEMPGKVVACLREKKPMLSGKCQARISRLQLEAAKDFRLDAQLYTSCKADAGNVCKEVEPGHGRVNACLREKRESVSWECQEELFRVDVENADDLRFSVRLFTVCLPEKKRFCADVAPGNSRAKDCLEAHRSKPGFGDDCKGLLDQMIEDRAHDFRLDVHLRQQCDDDIAALCDENVEKSKTVNNGDGRVVTCLQDFRREIRSPDCKASVYAAMERASEDIRFSANLAEACADDRQRLCGNIAPGSARVIRCLQSKRDVLSATCRTTMFDHDVWTSESIDFNKPLRDACADEIGKLCHGVPAGDGGVLWCLREQASSADVGSECRSEIRRLEHMMGQDYRLNNRLRSACDEDIGRLCDNACPDYLKGTSCGGRVLRCLTEKKDAVKSSDCKHEIFYFIKMEVEDFGNDVLLAEACHDDVDKHCKDVEPGEGRVHACLRAARGKLSPPCRKEELALELLEADNFELRLPLKRACGEERNVFCSDVETGQARIFRCLVHSLGEPDFGDKCREQVVQKLQRRQDNWKFDVGLRSACAGDADEVCGGVDHDADHAEMTRCLISKIGNVTESCAHEVSRAAHMALYVWQPGSSLSSVCDADVNKTCLAKWGGSIQKAGQPGVVLACLEKAISNTTEAAGKGKDKKAQGLKSDCATLVHVAEPPDEMAEFETNLQAISRLSAALPSKETLAQMGVWDHREGVTITGYTALFCFSALCTLVVLGLTHAYRRWRGIADRGYVQVIKSGDV